MTTNAICEGVLRGLALETSSLVGSLAAFRSAGDRMEIVASQVLPDDLRSAQSLVPAIDELLKTCDWRAGELDLVCTTTGPGSFTGLRIGVTVAKTLAYASGARLVGVHTLAAIAAAGASDRKAWAILDAQRQELFAAFFPPNWQINSDFFPETIVVDVDAWLAQLRAGDIVTGPPLEKLLDRLPPGVLAANDALWSPSSEVVARLGTAALSQGREIDPLQLVPCYFRQSAAEEKAQTRS